MNGNSNREMPNLFIIGAAKCGTTSLHYYLDLHPEISMSRIKEPMFFLDEEFRDSWPHSPVARSRSEYLSLFQPGSSVRGEASTMYSMHPNQPGVPARVHSQAPGAKLIYLVRDPVERVPAAWVQRMGAREASNRSTDGLVTLAEHIGDFDHPRNYYIWPGMYMTQIRRYLEFFPRESILIVDSDELKAERETVLREIFGFLEVDPEFMDPAFAEERNTLSDKRMESGAYVRLTHSRILRRLVDLIPGRPRDWMIEAVRRPLLLPAEKPELDPVLRARLEDHFRPEVEALREFTGQKFDGWSV